MKRIIIVVSFFLVLCVKLFSASGDIILKLETDDGSSALHIEDSSGVTVSSITSDGDAYYLNNVDIDGTLDVDSVVTLNNDITVIGDLTISSITSTGSTYFLKDVNIAGDLGVSTITSTGNLDITGRILPNGAAGTDGQILTTYTSSMTWTLPAYKWEGTPNIYYTGGNVGIGTNNPREALEINGELSFSDTEGSVFNINKIEGAGDLRFAGDATGENDVYIDSSGNVGIGTAGTGSHRLTVNGSANIQNGFVYFDYMQVAQESSSVSVSSNTSVIIDTNDYSGWGFVLVENAQEYVKFIWDNSGTVTLLENSSNVVTTDTDANLCIIGSEGEIAIKNRLGSTKEITYTVTKQGYGGA